jgi:Replication protein P
VEGFYMSRTLMKAIENRDSGALAKLYGDQPVSVKSIVNPDAEKLVDALFRQLKQVFPASSQTNLRTESDEAAAKKQWIAAFAEAGIRTREQLAAGMRCARSSESPFWPSPGQFVAWCQKGAIQSLGLPSEEDLFGMVLKYSAERGYYRSAERYPWQSNACWLMVTKLYSEMRGLSLSEPDLRKRCAKELAAMAKRIGAGEEIPAPAVMLEKLYAPVSKEKARGKIAELRAQLSLPRKGDKHAKTGILLTNTSNQAEPEIIHRHTPARPV